MRQPEEIKKGLECCSGGTCRKGGCPYAPFIKCGSNMHDDALEYILQLEEATRCADALLKDAIACFRQLEAQISEANGKIEARDKEIDRMRLAFAKQTREVAEYKLFLLKSVENATGSLPKWINVKERLPEEGGKYIVCTEKGAVYCTRFRRFGDGGTFGVDINTNITHWMPLPEPPKEG